MNNVFEPKENKYKFFVFTEDERNPVKYYRSRFEVPPGYRPQEIDPCRSMTEVIEEWRQARNAQRISREKDLERRRNMLSVLLDTYMPKPVNATFAPLTVNYKEELTITQPKYTKDDVISFILDNFAIESDESEEDSDSSDEGETYLHFDPGCFDPNPHLSRATLPKQFRGKNLKSFYKSVDDGTLNIRFSMVTPGRLPGETNPFYRPSDYPLLGGLKDKDKKKKKVKLVRRRKRPNKRIRKKNMHMTFVGRNPNDNRFGPPVTRSRLAYISDLVQVGASGYTVKTFQLCINDMDPAILSTIMAGQERFTTYYFEYLNYSCKVTAKCTNIAAEAVNFYINISTQDWTTLIATWQDARDCAENPNSTKPVTWDQNVDTKTITQLFKPADLLPRGIYKFSEIYAGLFNANPVAPIFINLVWYADNSGAEVKVDTNIVFDVWTSWYIQRNQRDSGPLEDDYVRSRTQRVGSPIPLTTEQKQIAEKNSQAWVYAKSAPPRREYDHLAGKQIMDQQHVVRPVSQLIRPASTSRIARCA